jgi:acetyl-CoA carboxylase carboxyltransferase component
LAVAPRRRGGKQHAEGELTAWERIALLPDEGSFAVSW